MAGLRDERDPSRRVYHRRKAVRLGVPDLDQKGHQDELEIFGLQAERLPVAGHPGQSRDWLLTGARLYANRAGPVWKAAKEIVVSELLREHLGAGRPGRRALLRKLAQPLVSRLPGSGQKRV
jgi:hypothetical protein